MFTNNHLHPARWLRWEMVSLSGSLLINKKMQSVETVHTSSQCDSFRSRIPYLMYLTKWLNELCRVSGPTALSIWMKKSATESNFYFNCV